ILGLSMHLENSAPDITKSAPIAKALATSPTHTVSLSIVIPPSLITFIFPLAASTHSASETTVDDPKPVNCRVLHALDTPIPTFTQSTIFRSLIHLTHSLVEPFPQITYESGNHFLIALKAGKILSL